MVKDNFDTNTNKCNLFVFDVIVEARAAPYPKVSKYWLLARPPLAREWADVDLKIPGWEGVEKPRPGDVVAEAHDYADATGHVSIVVGARETVSASSQVGGVIVNNDCGLCEGQQPTFRRHKVGLRPRDFDHLP